MAKIISAKEAANLIKDESTVAVTGFGLSCWAEEMGISIEERFKETGHPKNLTVMHASAVGNRKDKGMSHLGHEGLVKRWIGGIAIASPINVGIIRGTVADENGNLTMDKEGLLMEALPVAQAARNSGGIVIAQVESIAAAGTLNPKNVQVPGILIDYIVVAKPENHFQTEVTQYNPAFSGELKVPVNKIPALPLDERKVIARRCAEELIPNAVLNLGVGIPANVASIVAEEEAGEYTTFTTEAGSVGGISAGGLEIEVKDGKLNIINEGRAKKFIKQVQQITFSGNYASKKKQNVTYVTERAVFKLVDSKLVLIEIAPGVDLQKDILDQMDFEPVISKDLKLMDAGIFSEKWGSLKEIIKSKQNA